jgi:uncharacterized membrane protein YkoI
MKTVHTLSIIAIVSSIGLTGLTLGRDSEPVVPMGALAHAAATLERQTGGRILEIRLADQTGAPAFEAALTQGGAISYLRIASPSDDVTEIEVSHLPPWLQNYPLDAYRRSVSKARVPVDQAITKAEQTDHAPAIDAGVAEPLSGANAVLAYFVETVKDSKKRDELAVDATSGAMIANPQSLYASHKPVELTRRLASLSTTE